MKDSMITATTIDQAYERIKSRIRHTELELASGLSTQTTSVFLKCEQNQLTGSFKPRGSFNKLLSLSPEELKNGVVASTAGNHGVAISYVAKSLGVRARIFLPRWADRSKIDSLKSNQAELTFCDSVEEARDAAQQLAREEGIPFVSAYNDSEMIAGGGTIAIEILNDCPEVDTVVVGIGGGGLASGIGTYLKDRKPNVRVIGVQAQNNALMSEWLKQKREMRMDLKPTIAEGLAVNMESGVITFPILQCVIDDVILVSEDEICRALAWAHREMKFYLEPSGAATIAAIQKLNLSGRSCVVGVLTGGNVSKERFAELSLLTSTAQSKS